MHNVRRLLAVRRAIKMAGFTAQRGCQILRRLEILAMLIRRLVFSAMILFWTTVGWARESKLETHTSPADAGPDFKVQGEYLGKIKESSGEIPVGVQVIALGKGKFTAVVHFGGLPGDGWVRGNKHQKADGHTVGARTSFRGSDWTLTIFTDTLLFADTAGRSLGTLHKVARVSPTAGAKPPAGAIVLFDGSGVDHFSGARMTEDKLLLAGGMTRSEYGDAKLHLEFRLPFMPTARGQDRANSGTYLQNRYEVQVLDSFGLEGADNECGGLYKVAQPAVNMCYPPLAWQTYDIDFTAPRFDGEKKVKSARLTVRHNGVVIHDDLELPNVTLGGLDKEYPGKGPLLLQWHGNPVVYRNVWLLEK